MCYCTTNDPSTGGARAHLGIALGLTARGGDDPGQCDPPGRPRWGHTTGKICKEFGKPEPNQAKSLTKRKKSSQKTTKNHKNGHFPFFLAATSGFATPASARGGAHPGLRRPANHPHLGTTRRCPRCARAPPVLGSLCVTHDAEGRLADAEGRLADAEGRLAEAQTKPRAQPTLHERESSSLDTAVFGAKWAALYGAISTARQAAERHWKGAVRLTVSRTDVVGTVLQAFDKSCRTTEALLKPLRVKFEGEHGEDEGGLTSELFTFFFAALPHYTVLQTESGPPVCLFERGSDNNTCFLPAAHDHCARRADVYETIGRIVVKALVEERPVPSKIASSFLVDFCLCVEPAHSAKPAASLAEDLRAYGGTDYEWVTCRVLVAPL